ncbi:TRAP transporter small permease [Chloroflexota bacterium]
MSVMAEKPRITRILDIWEEGIMAGGVIFISGMLFGNVIGRAMKHSIIPAEELAYIAMILITFFGVSYATRKGRHIRMGALLELSGLKVKKIMIYFEAIVGGLLMITFTYMAIQYTINQVNLGRMTVALNWPYWIFAIWLIFGFSLSAIHYVRLVIKNFKQKEVWLSPEEKGEYI